MNKTPLEEELRILSVKASGIERTIKGIQIDSKQLSLLDARIQEKSKHGVLTHFQFVSEKIEVLMNDFNNLDQTLNTLNVSDAISSMRKQVEVVITGMLNLYREIYEAISISFGCEDIQLKGNYHREC